jgi:glycosyltransferase involved in cell wall biosynthesis
VVLEAMTQAKPVIVSRGVGAAKLVETHECGIVVEPEAQAISLAICQIFSNEREALEMGRRGRAAAATVYGWQNVARTMAGHYAELIASR